MSVGRCHLVNPLDFSEGSRLWNGSLIRWLLLPHYIDQSHGTFRPFSVLIRRSSQSFPAWGILVGVMKAFVSLIHLFDLTFYHLTGFGESFSTSVKLIIAKSNRYFISIEHQISLRVISLYRNIQFSEWLAWGNTSYLTTCWTVAHQLLDSASSWRSVPSLRHLGVFLFIGSMLVILCLMLSLLFQILFSLKSVVRVRE